MEMFIFDDNRDTTRGSYRPPERVAREFQAAVDKARAEGRVSYARTAWSSVDLMTRFTGPGLDGAVVKPSPVPVVVEPAPVRYGFMGGNVA